ncbi:helix-turn-helix transcriptional regulator [Clostridium botulinum]|nr:helix-turn-helix transcriptional regulator [Clostridium botulinum]NFK69163.1 helix-turn-helix transcriptional regulator [Clostridium botulinum]NFK97512.1 helix-turn-helix transcriptional regulator [Clostridium botulinum]
MDFNERLKIWMKENGIKQIDIASKADVTKGYVSNVVTGKIPPSNTLIQTLAKMSNKSVHWWLFGEDEYKGLASLNALIDTFIKSKEIKEDGTYDKDIEMILKTMLDKEIRDKLKEAQR